MHELGITQNILQEVIQQAEQLHGWQVTDVYLSNGSLSGIADDSLRFYWDTIIENTLCAESQLHFEHVLARVACLDCQQTFVTEQRLELCPNCQGGHLKIMAGNRLQLDSIEIDVAQ